MKPILKIETPSNTPEAEVEKLFDSIVEHPISQEYHVIVVKGNSDYFSFEIIVAPDIKLHLPQ
jgi:hypothetical protein